MAKSNSPEGTRAVRVWDLPLRLFHWLLVICLIGSFVSIKTGNVDVHLRFGYAALSLILFRLVWGFVGPRYARFSSFVFSPASLLAWLRGSPDAPRTLGHSPAGALSVFALLFAVALQATTGLFTSDDLFAEGPLARHVSNAFVQTAGRIHNQNEFVILGLVVLHLAAIAFYRFAKRTSLVRPMIVGDKLVPVGSSGRGPAEPAARDDLGIRVRALIVLGIAIALVMAIVWWPPV